MTFITAASLETDNQAGMQLKGGLFPLTTLQLLTADLALLAKQLQLKITQAPNFFNYIPIVIDLHHLNKLAISTETDPSNADIIAEQATAVLDFTGLKNLLLQNKLIPVGVKNATKEQQQQAIAANLAILRSNPKFDNHSRLLQPNAIKEAPLATKITTKPMESHQSTESLIASSKLDKNRLIIHPVRSGQQIYAPDGDITVIGSVSHGSELLADGNIHVYGALRGRALAGINNNTNVRIFCNSLEADLISIAGQFKISENIDPKFWKKQVQIYLTAGKLEISEFL